MTFDELEPGDFRPTSIEGGLPKLVRIWEHLRDLNTGGYGGAVLVDVKDAVTKGKSGVTSCSPFTATCIYMALDSRSVDPGQPWSLKEPYQPVFDGGKPLDVNFYRLHNGFSLSSYASVKDKKFAAWKADFKSRYVDRIPQLAKDFNAFNFINHSAGSVIALNLGKRVDPKKMRRGDMVGIDWHNGNGHATFCWNVHLDKNGDVDCFQFISSNGTSASGGAGITLFRYPGADPAYLEASGGKYRKKKDMFSGVIEDPRAYPEYIQKPYWWFGMPGVKKGDIDLDNFGVPAKAVQISYADSMDVSVHVVHVARLHGVTPPDPYLRAEGGKTREKQESSKPPPLTKAMSKKVGEAASPGPAQLDKAPPGQPHPVQEALEGYLQTLWKTRWISKDPGDPSSINDPESQAAIRDYQEKFMKGDVPRLGHPDPKTRQRIAKAAAAAANMPMVKAALLLAHDRGEIQSAPSADPMQLDHATRAAVKEFQHKKKLGEDGIPGHDTQEKLSAYMKEAAKSASTGEKQSKGAEPKILSCYFTRNNGPPGKPATLNVTTTPACNGKTHSVDLFQGSKKVLSAQMSIAGGKGSIALDVPNGIPPGSKLVAKVSVGDLTAETVALFTVSASFVDLPLVLAGPIVRRAEPDQVWFWLATRDEVTDCTPELSHGGFGIPVQPESHTMRLGEHLWVTLVSARPKHGTFPEDVIIEYDLAFTYETPKSSVRVEISKLGLDINYPPFRHPTFLIASKNRRLVHGSCRRPGAYYDDAHVVFDQWLRKRISDVAERPSALLLTGDQIYADDVAEPLFKAVQKLAADVCGYVEWLPREDGGTVSVDDYVARYQGGVTFDRRNDYFPKMTRKALTALGRSPIGFTTEDGEGHLLSFPEFAAMYLAVWNPQLCGKYGVDDASYEKDNTYPLKNYGDAVGAARRVLANMATYMVFDDHEITDDWNIDDKFQSTTQKNSMARRILANGLAAGWAFQGWGNDPLRFDKGFRAAIQQHLDEIRGAKGRPGGTGKSFDKTLLDMHWSFVAPTNPPALCVDTRTSREFPAGKTVILSGTNVWPDLRALSKSHKLSQKELLLVLPTPLLLHQLFLEGQRQVYPLPDGLYSGDYETYGNNPEQRFDLIKFLHDDIFQPTRAGDRGRTLVVFSGDVHFGSVVDGIYAHGASLHDVDDGKGDWAVRVLQITSSPIKNVKKNAFVDKRWWTAGETDAANAGESTIQMEEYDAKDLPDGTTLAMRANVETLAGKLGRESFIFENHFCVVDLPVGEAASVAVSFIGTTIPHFEPMKGGMVGGSVLAEAKTTVNKKNDPALFEDSKWEETTPGAFRSVLTTGWLTPLKVKASK